MATITDVQMKIAELQEQLLSAHPQMPHLLKDIHATLRSDPETVTLLTDVEVGTIISALQKYTGNFISAKAAATKSPKAALKNLSADDL